MCFFRFITLGLCLMLAAGLSGCGKKKTTALPLSPSNAVPPGPPMPNINPTAMAVSVNGHVITWGEVLGEMQRLHAAGVKATTAQQAADSLIMRYLLSQTADKANLPIPPQEITTAMDNMRRQVPTNTTLEAVLRSNGLTEATFRASLLNTLKVNHLLQQKTEKVTKATDVEISQFVKDNPNLLQVPETASVRIILVATKPADTTASLATQKSRAEGIRKQLLAGADFAKLAATMSDDPSKTRGGQLPPLQRGVIPDALFETAAFGQKIGEISPVLDTHFGLVILQVQARTPAKTLKLDDVKVKDRVREVVTDRKRQQVLQTYANELRSKAKIVYAKTQ